MPCLAVGKLMPGIFPIAPMGNLSENLPYPAFTGRWSLHHWWWTSYFRFMYNLRQQGFFCKCRACHFPEMFPIAPMGNLSKNLPLSSAGRRPVHLRWHRELELLPDHQQSSWYPCELNPLFLGNVPQLPDGENFWEMTMRFACCRAW